VSSSILKRVKNLNLSIMKQLLCLLLTVLSLKTIAQPYAVENGNTRHRFAQLEVGVSQYYAPVGGKTQLLSNNVVKDYQFGASGTICAGNPI
jgi:hypothetical protein